MGRVEGVFAGTMWYRLAYVVSPAVVIIDPRNFPPPSRHTLITSKSPNRQSPLFIEDGIMFRGISNPGLVVFLRYYSFLQVQFVSDRSHIETNDRRLFYLQYISAGSFVLLFISVYRLCIRYEIVCRCEPSPDLP